MSIHQSHKFNQICREAKEIDRPAYRCTMPTKIRACEHSHFSVLSVDIFNPIFLVKTPKIPLVAKDVLCDVCGEAQEAKHIK